MRGRRDRDHLMVITSDRVFYAGLLGRPGERAPGAWHIYVAIAGGLTLTSQARTERDVELVVAPPNLRHTIASDHRSALCLIVEPESVAPEAAERLAGRLAGTERLHFAARIRAAYERFRRQGHDDIGSAEIDLLCFGERLAPRPLDPRVHRAIAHLDAFAGTPASAASCASLVGLSPSRFLHLFKDETGIAFRDFRAWKRARHLLNYVNAPVNFARLAQDIGYPNSTHFSHSIRRYYGLQPRAIFEGSRDLAIYRSRSAAPAS